MGLLSEEFWAGKRVLVTGHTGFKGSWLVVLLDHLGAEATGYSLPTVDDPSLFSAAGVRDICRDLRGDVRDLRALHRAVETAQPQIVVHLAAQAIVARGFADPFGTLSHNVLGTAGLLEAVRCCGSATAVVVATTDKVYRNRGPGNGYEEADLLGGNEPYGVSKACAELVTECYRDTFLSPAGIRVASARAGNVVGGGDWGSPGSFRISSGRGTRESRSSCAIPAMCAPGSTCSTSSRAISRSPRDSAGERLRKDPTISAHALATPLTWPPWWPGPGLCIRKGRRSSAAVRTPPTNRTG